MTSFNETEQHLEQVEMSMEQAQKAIELDDALKRLIKNKDFDLLISENYLKGEAERVVGALGDEAMVMNEIGYKMLKKSLVGIGAFRQYLLKIQIQGNNMKMAMSEYRETQTELLQEQMESEV